MVLSGSSAKMVKNKKFHAFVRYVLKRRATKEGRFLRVQLKSGAWVDLAPEGSLASGMKLRRKAAHS
jgi:hypothetical protein